MDFQLKYQLVRQQQNLLQDVIIIGETTSQMAQALLPRRIYNLITKTIMIMMWIGIGAKSSIIVLYTVMASLTSLIVRR